MLIAKYTANASGVVPTFNSGYVYTVNETESNGVYTVEINADTDFTSCSFNGKSNLLTVEYLKITNLVTNMGSMFFTCSNLTTIGDVSNWNTSNVISMRNTFRDCSSLTQLDLSNWDTSNVENMSYMFQNCSKLTQLDVSKWDTSKVTNMASMFLNCSSLTQLDVSNFDTSNVTNMSSMFSNCPNLRKIKLLNTIFPQLSTVLPTRTSDNPGYLFTYEEISNDKNWITHICKDYQVQVSLPCQLMKMGNISDKLYWDVEKGHYCIEKMIGDDYAILTTPEIIDLPHLNQPLKLFQKYTTSIIIFDEKINPSKITINYKDIQDYK